MLARLNWGVKRWEYDAERRARCQLQIWLLRWLSFLRLECFGGGIWTLERRGWGQASEWSLAELQFDYVSGRFRPAVTWPHNGFMHRPLMIDLSTNTFATSSPAAMCESLSYNTSFQQDYLRYKFSVVSFLQKLFCGLVLGLVFQRKGILLDK